MDGVRRATTATTAIALLAALAGCTQANCMNGGAGGAPGPTVPLERGHLGPHPWQLVAWEQGGLLGLGLDGASQKTQYSGGLGFCSGPSAGFWLDAAGPDDATFYYGPAPASAKYAVFTAAGHAPIFVPTTPIPQTDGLPSGRFFVTDPPDSASVTWNVKLEDADGHTVPFANF